MRQGIKEKDIQDMQKCFNRIDIIIRRIQEYNPNAHILIQEADTITLTGIYDASVDTEVVAEKYIPKMTVVNMA